MQKFLDAFHNHYASDAYNYLGAFYSEKETIFRVYAPHASKVSIVGDFNYWSVGADPMTKIDDRGVWEGKVGNLKVYDNYKFAITHNNWTFFKQDPYGYHFETDGGSCSKIYPINNYKFTDNEWMENRNSHHIYDGPVNIYEVHLGSWMKSEDGHFLNYRVLAKKLVSYVKKMGYNYIELLPIMEHPFLGSWGYQVTGYFGVTSRYGVPDDFKYFVEWCHKNGIGVILDWVPAHFPKDSFGLVEFDGEPLYEDAAPTRKEHAAWGTRIFNFAKPEVKSFLISSACFYFDKYHIDGIRVDAVAAMLYLDYGRTEWVPNIYGGNYNLEAIGFLQDLNTTCFDKFGNILMIAEESTAFPKVTKPIYDGGLGFNFKWNMGWMNDTLRYIETDPYFRGDHHNQMTFAMSYAFSEKYVLSVSHDEVVHLKKSLLDKMPGYYDDKFSNFRCYLTYMMTHAGKKLLFMGQEFGMFKEWDERKQLDWMLLDYPKHQELQTFTRDINNLYLKKSELFEIDDSWDGFTWVAADNWQSATYAYIRRNKKGEELLIIINFSGLYYDNYTFTSDALNGKYKVIFNTDSKYYGGEEKYLYPSFVKVENHAITLPINKLSALILKRK